MARSITEFLIREKKNSSVPSLVTGMSATEMLDSGYIFFSSANCGLQGEIIFPVGAHFTGSVLPLSRGGRYNCMEHRPGRKIVAISRDSTAVLSCGTVFLRCTRWFYLLSQRIKS